MEQSYLPAEHHSMDSNREEARREQEHTTKEAGYPVQVSSLGLTSSIHAERSSPDGGARIRTDSQEAAESTDDSIDVTKMTEQLRDMHKDFSERRPEKGAFSPSYVQHPGEVDPDDNEVYRKANSCVPDYIGGINLNCQVAMAAKLNDERADYKDYRLVSDAMGHSTNTIQAAKMNPNPMMKIFEISIRVKGKDFVEALFMNRRFDAMKILVDHYYKVEFQQSMSHEEKRQQFQTVQPAGSPLGGSMEENMLKKAKEERKRSTSSPEEVTTPEPTNEGLTTASGQPLATASSPHRQHAFDDEDDEWANLGPGAKPFWNNIPSYSESTPHLKKLKNVKKAFKNLHKEETTYLAFACDWKLIVHALDLLPESDGEQLVKAEKFRHMLAWFGPPTPDENGCMKMAGKLRAKSVTTTVDGRGEKRKLSWFAGHYGMQESARILESQERGSFLVRFSTSYADDGWFVLAFVCATDQDRSSFRSSKPEKTVCRNSLFHH